MYPYRNEDVAWQRLLDMQREMENSRIWAGRAETVAGLGVGLVRRAWIRARLAMRRTPRRHPVVRTGGECETA